MRKLLWGFVVIMTASIIVLACQKEASSPRDANTAFDNKAAKEWYYGTFKKSPDYAGYNAAMNGKKLPDWKNSKSMRFGNYWVVDFPLVKQKSSVTFPASFGLTDANKRRVAEASFSRMAFIKDNSGRIETREIQFIPDMDYLVRHNYDISSNSFAQMDKDYSGMLVVKTWNGSEVSRSIIRDGKIINKLKKQNSNPTIRSERTQDIVCIIEWARDCSWEDHGDQAATWECGEWYPTGNQWCWDDGQLPPDVDPCIADPGSPQCSACTLYGIGCEEGGGGEGEDCSVVETYLDANTADELVTSTTTDIDPITRDKVYVWKCLVAPTSLVYWNSRESATQEKVNNAWQFQSLQHTALEKHGVYLGVQYTATVESSTPTVGLYNSIMSLHIHYLAEAVCRGFPLGRDDYYDPAHLFNVND